MKVLPPITILIVSLNNERTLKECLRRISEQDYPKRSIEYLAVDGGSSDRTKDIFRKYHFHVLQSPIVHNAEAQRAYGIKKAKHNLIVSIDADNYLSTNQWLREMVQPFIDDTRVVHANTMYYGYRKNDTIFNRYIGLFGNADPIVFYVGRPDRLPRYQKRWKLGTIVAQNDAYVLVDFIQNTLPTVGCNGVVYRRDLLLKHAQSGLNDFLHIDVFADLVGAGFHRFAIVKNDVVHDSAASLGKLMKKRIAFLEGYYLKSHTYGPQRRYLIYNPNNIQDTVKLFLFVLYTVTFIRPLVDSIRGYLVIPDIAWFVHPIMCWVYLYAYSRATIKKIIHR